MADRLSTTKNMGNPSLLKGTESALKPSQSKRMPKEVTFDYPKWLVSAVIDNSKKANLPLDWLANKINEVATSGNANPYHSTDAPQGRRKRQGSEEGVGTDEERDMRQDKFKTRRQTTISPKSKKQISGPATMSSKDGAARKPAVLPKRLTRSQNQETAPSSTTKETSTSLFIPETEVNDVEYRVLGLPPWYTRIKMTDRSMKELSKRPSSSDTQALKALSSMKTHIDRCEREVSRVQLKRIFEELRDQVHKAEITLHVTCFIIRKCKMLENEYGLPRIFLSKNVNFPWDLKADAWQLYSRWHGEIFSIDLLRGINPRKGTDRNADSIDQTWKSKFSPSPKFYGEGHLVLGQWWPTQLTTVRDGAHGSAQGGIYGEKGKGAYSIVLSGSGHSQYDDEDNGVDIWYSGTDGKDFIPTENTLRLIESCDTIHNQVRVLRSHQLPKKNPYRPVAGLRYDGLYEVIEKELVDDQKQCYRFRLVRSKGQYPIRCANNAARRPTIFEIAEDKRLRENGR